METLTNGVDFSLVAGACCQITFTNYLKVGPATLNINSTGAKYWGYRYSDSSAKTARLTLSNTSDSGWIPACSLFVIYDGTYYMSYYGGSFQFYLDYNDN